MYKYDTRKLIDNLLEVHKEYIEAEMIRATAEYSIEKKNKLIERAANKLEAFKRRLIRLVDLHEELYSVD